MTRPLLRPSERVRAFGYCVIALIYFVFAQLVASRAASGLASGDWAELVERGVFLFLLLVGYGLMGRVSEHQRQPLQAMGLVLRPSARDEFGRGAALGWGMVIASILPMVLAGGLVVSVWTTPHQFAILLLDLVVLAVASLAEEVVFRGYPFQRLIEAIGPVLATIFSSVIFGLVHIFNPSSNRATITITVFTGFLLSLGYLRTRALWFPWGWHFAWNASLGLLFGLPISGLTRFSPVIQSNTIGPVWMTGGDYGPEGSLVTAGVILVGTIFVFRLTRDYAYKYAQPVIVPGGMPVDLDAMSDVLAPHHSAPSGEKLVQINTFSPPDQAHLPNYPGTSRRGANSLSGEPDPNPTNSPEIVEGVPLDPPKRDG
jgi:CAAX protease family protein